MKYQIIDQKTKEVLWTYKNSLSAFRKADKLDKPHGYFRHRVVSKMEFSDYPVCIFCGKSVATIDSDSTCFECCD